MDFCSKIAGVSRRNADGTHRQDLVRACEPGEALYLLRRPDNPYDANAVAVCGADGRQLGYLTADVAAQIAPRLDAGREVWAVVTDVTGGTRDKPHFGVNIRIVHGAELPAAVPAGKPAGRDAGIIPEPPEQPLAPRQPAQRPAAAPAPPPRVRPVPVTPPQAGAVMIDDAVLCHFTGQTDVRDLNTATPEVDRHAAAFRLIGSDLAAARHELWYRRLRWAAAHLGAEPWVLALILAAFAGLTAALVTYGSVGNEVLIVMTALVVSFFGAGGVPLLLLRDTQGETAENRREVRAELVRAARDKEADLGRRRDEAAEVLRHWRHLREGISRYRCQAYQRRLVVGLHRSHS